MPTIMGVFLLIIEHLSNIIDPILFSLLVYNQLSPKVYPIGKSILLVVGTGIWLTLSQIQWQFSFVISLTGHLALMIMFVYSFKEASAYQKFILPCLGALFPLISNLILTAFISLFPETALAAYEPSMLRLLLVLAYILINFLCYFIIRKIAFQSNSFTIKNQIEGSLVVFSSILLCAYIFDQSPRAAVYPDLSHILVLACLGLAYFIAYFLYTFYNTLRQRDENQLLEEAISNARAETLALDSALVRQDTVLDIHHDLRNHFIALRNYAQLGELSDLIVYLEQMEIEFAPARNMIFTNHKGLNAIISEKLWYASQQNIKIVRRIAVPDILPATEVVICAILGNLLDNAIEATLLLANLEDRNIWLTAYSEENAWRLEISNTYTGVVAKDNEKFLSAKDDPGHGRGLIRVIRLVEKSKGKIDISYDGSIFKVVIYWNVS